MSHVYSVTYHPRRSSDCLSRRQVSFARVVAFSIPVFPFILQRRPYSDLRSRRTRELRVHLQDPVALLLHPKAPSNVRHFTARYSRRHQDLQHLLIIAPSCVGAEASNKLSLSNHHLVQSVL